LEQARKEIPCPFFAKGYCKYGGFCQLRHDENDLVVAPTRSEEEEEEESQQNYTCGICLEDVTKMGHKFGLLSCCNHMFCFECLMEWRKQGSKEAEDRRSCPTCRKHSDYVVPSPVFAFTRDGKDRIVKDYKRKLSNIPCKHFVVGKLGSCPFGRDCFYAHLSADTGEDIKLLDDSMEDLQEERRRRRRRRQRRRGTSTTTSHLDEEVEMINSFLFLLDLYSSGMARAIYLEEGYSSEDDDDDDYSA
jgi:E3 ubiquitin-protein ligase makorin